MQPVLSGRADGTRYPPPLPSVTPELLSHRSSLRGDCASQRGRHGRGGNLSAEGWEHDAAFNADASHTYACRWCRLVGEDWCGWLSMADNTSRQRSFSKLCRWRSGVIRNSCFCDGRRAACARDDVCERGGGEKTGLTQHTTTPPPRTVGQKRGDFDFLYA